MNFGTESLDSIQRAAFRAAEDDVALNDACPHPFHTDAGRLFKHMFICRRAALRSSGGATTKEFPMTWMITASGAEYHLTGPATLGADARPILIEDIAHHLAIINRFTGASMRPYSVAEHSLLCADIGARLGASALIQLALLMHDAHEAYTTDLSSPAKQAVNAYSAAGGGLQAWTAFENEHERAVRQQFGLLTAFAAHRSLITSIDLQALATERRDLTAYNDASNSAWTALGDGTDEAHRPAAWVDLMSQERAATTWQAWRAAFLNRFAFLSSKVAQSTPSNATPAPSA